MIPSIHAKRKMGWSGLVVACAVVFIILSAILVPIVILSNSSSSNAYDITDPYDYQVRPGTPEWASFTTHAEMVNACQIPELILNRMSTAALVDSVLDYPLFLDVIAFNTLQEGFDVVSSRFNGLQELLQRQDAASQLIAKYAAVDMTADNPGQEAWSFYLPLMELVLAQEEILRNLTNDEAQYLLSETRVKIKTEKEHPDVYGPFDLQSTSVLAGRLLQVIEAPDFNEMVESNTDMRRFLLEADHASLEMLSIIEEQLSRYLDSLEP